MGDQALQGDQVVHPPVAGVGHPEAAASLVRGGLGRRQVAGEVGQDPALEQQRGVVGGPVRLQPVERLGCGRVVAGEGSGPGQPRQQPPPLGRVAGGTQRLPVRGDGAGVPSGHQHVRAQGEQRPALGVADVLAHRVDQRERVAVGPDGRVGAGGLQQERRGGADVAGLQQLVADPRRRRAEAAQPLGGVTVQREQPVRRQPVEQGVAHQRVPEAVAGAGPLDRARGERVVEQRVRLLLADAATGRRTRRCRTSHPAPRPW